MKKLKNPETYKVLVCSTDHVLSRDAELLEEDLGSMVMVSPGGWYLRFYTEEYSFKRQICEFSGELRNLLQCARDAGYRMVQFDQHATVLEFEDSEHPRDVSEPFFRSPNSEDFKCPKCREQLETPSKWLVGTSAYCLLGHEWRPGILPNTVLKTSTCPVCVEFIRLPNEYRHGDTVHCHLDHEWIPANE